MSIPKYLKACFIKNTDFSILEEREFYFSKVKMICKANHIHLKNRHLLSIRQRDEWIYVGHEFTGLYYIFAFKKGDYEIKLIQGETGRSVSMWHLSNVLKKSLYRNFACRLTMSILFEYIELKELNLNK